MGKKETQKEKAPFDLSFPFTLNKSVMKDTMGRYRVHSLFDKSSVLNCDLVPVFTMDDNHTLNLPSFKRLYVEIGDPSEYKIALALLGSWEHWVRLCESTWFKPFLEECRDELSAKLRSEAVERIKKDGLMAFSESVRLAANKFLANGDYKIEVEKVVEEERELKKRGRPSKEEIERRTKEILTEEGIITADLNRIKGPSGAKDLN